MAAILIRNVDDEVKQKLRLQAALSNRTMEAQARHIIYSALNNEVKNNKSFVKSVRDRVFSIGGVELEVEKREIGRELPNFEET